jgi:hypothetical protein
MGLGERYLNAAYNGDREEMNRFFTLSQEKKSCRKADQYVIRGGFLDIVKELVQTKKNFMSIFDMCIFAAKVGNVKIIEYLLKRGEIKTELISSMVFEAVDNDHLNVLCYLWENKKFKSTIFKTVYNKILGSNLLMMSSAMYNFEITEWILKNLGFDIETVDYYGFSVLENTIDCYDLDPNVTPNDFFKMVKLIVTVGKADATPVWNFLDNFWSKKESDLKPGEDQMLKDFIKTLYLFKQPDESVEKTLRASRYAYLVNEVEKVRDLQLERETGLPNVLEKTFPRVIGDMISSMDNSTPTTDEMWEMSSVVDTMK